jgi:antitoxin ParD1/3/4
MTTNVYLTAELEGFARACVASGRYNNVSEVVRAALRLLQEDEEKRAAFLRSLEEAEAEAERDGWVTAEEVLAEMDEIIAAEEARQRK